MEIKCKQYVEVYLGWLDDLVGVNIDKIQHYSMHETELFIFFTPINEQRPEGWDVQLHFDTEEEARDAYKTLGNYIRRRKMRVL